MASRPHEDPASDEEPDVVDMDEVAEEIAGDDEDGDVNMSDPDDDEGEELQLINDSVAYFDAHKDSVFTIAQHPTNPNIIATGGSEGDTDDAPGKGYVFVVPEIGQRDGPVLPPSFAADPQAAAQELASQRENVQVQPVFAIDGHTDSINSLAFTYPRGDFLVSGGLDGRLRAYRLDAAAAAAGPSFAFVGESQEVPEINWIAPCPSADYPDSIALGASDGSVWVYTIDPSDAANPLQIVQTYFLHTSSCTAGAWTPDGSMLATVDEEGSLYVWDVWGLAAAKGLVGENGQAVVSLTPTDQRFAVEGGLFSVAVEPRGGYLAVGGAGGAIRIVSLPRLTEQAAAPKAGKGKAGKAAGGRSAGGEAQAGQILAALQVQSDGIETLSFAPASATVPLLAAGSVDGSITVYDPSRTFSVRRHIQGAHDEFSVVKVEWVKQPQTGGQWLLTSCGMDGVVRRWNLQGATPSQHAPSATVAGLEKEWRGHRGDGEGGGVLGFVQGVDGKTVVTAGDDGIVLLFEA